ncbi:MAG: hypothetical protein M3546_00345 [Actinomycetota bacterium]|nr:hypothetical protein [Actinomycetota bacterium]
MTHHPVLDPFEPLQVDLGDDWDVNFLGVRTRRMFWIGGDQPRQDAGNLPRPDEEYLEWIDVLEAVSNARDRFTMVELGAGWGRWLVNAAAALHHRSDDMAYCLVGVEAEPTHFRWLRQHMLDNAIEPDRVELIKRRGRTRGRCCLVSHGGARGVVRPGNRELQRDPSVRRAGGRGNSGAEEENHPSYPVITTSSTRHGCLRSRG